MAGKAQEVRVPAGTRLYHGTATRSKFARLRGPMWLATHRGRARDFGPRVHAFETTRPLRLYVMKPGRDLREDFPEYMVLFDREPHAGPRKHEMTVVAGRGYDGWQLYGGSSSEEIMLFEPKTALRLVPDERTAGAGDLGRRRSRRSRGRRRSR